MERKIFQHLLELKSLQIRSSRVNEAVLVKRAVDDYHKSVQALGYETGGTLRRYPHKEYTFKNFEIFLYETLKGLQKHGTHNFQNISDVYKEVGEVVLVLRGCLPLNSIAIFHFCSLAGGAPLESGLQAVREGPAVHHKDASVSACSTRVHWRSLCGLQ